MRVLQQKVAVDIRPRAPLCMMAAIAQVAKGRLQLFILLRGLDLAIGNIERLKRAIANFL